MAREESRSSSSNGSSSSPAMDRLKSEAQSLVGALSERAMGSVRNKVSGATGRLTEYVDGGGGPGVMAALTGARNLAEGKSPGRSMFSAGFAGVKEKVAGLFRRGGKGGGSRKLKLTNIEESMDVGVPVSVAYNQWTQYADFPKFTKKVENVDHNKKEETKTNWKAQIFWSHRTWEATVTEQVPDSHIVWRSKGQKGHVDGAVTFHELAPNLTRILLALEYHPQGLFERTGNLWRAQGRRARLEFKNARRHIMTEGLLHADDLEGWRGTIHDGEVTESHDDAVAREEKERPEGSQSGSQRSGSRQSASRQSGSRQSGSRQSGSRQSGSRQSGSQRSGSSRTAAQGRQEGDEADEEREGEGRAASGGDTGNGRARSGRSTASRTRRTTRTRASEGEGSSNGRRSRAGAGTQRGGSA